MDVLDKTLSQTAVLDMARTSGRVLCEEEEVWIMVIVQTEAVLLMQNSEIVDTLSSVRTVLRKFCARTGWLC